MKKLLIITVLFAFTFVSILSNCTIGCAACRQKDNKCFQCNDAFINVQGNCTCESGFFVKNSTACQSCKVQLPYCSLCQSKTNCINCKDGLNRELTADGNCTCLKGFYDDNAPECKTCSGMVACLACNGIDKCTQCNSTLHRVINNNTGLCKCESRYYQSSKTCMMCNTLCNFCESITTCISCDINSVKQSDGSCACIDGYFLSSTNNSTNSTNISQGNESYAICKPCAQFMSGCLKCTSQTSCQEWQSKIPWILIGAGAVLIILIVGTIIWCRKRKQRKIYQKQSTLLGSNDGQTPHSYSDEQIQKYFANKNNKLIS